VVDQKQTTYSLTAFWFWAWLGTVFAGGVFGVLLAGPLGFFLGCLVASIAGTPIVVFAAVLAWCLWLTRYRITFAVIAGATTGVLTSLPVIGYFDIFVPVAGILGGLGGGIGGGLHWFRSKSDATSDEKPDRPWQFSMRDMFVHITVLSIVLALASSLVVAVQSARESGRRASCENNVRLLAGSLKNYHALNESLPPIFLADENDAPTLSWRVLAMDCIHYDVDFPANVDFAKPWNDPANAAFLAKLGSWNLRCPSLPDSPPGTTPYVAITGPGTHWTEFGTLDENAQQDAILVIEWPPSDIHWAEPREVTADEFLTWFESKDRKPRRHHRRGLQYIDSTGEVRVLDWKTQSDELQSLLTPHEPSTIHRKEPE
jgi:hypothetical protein